MTQPTLFDAPKTKYGFTVRHDAALDLCIASYGRCPFNCVKNGAPNCAWHVQQNDCEPAKIVNLQVAA